MPPKQISGWYVLIMMRSIGLVSGLLLFGCAPMRPQVPATSDPVDPQILQIWKKEFYDFAAALALATANNPTDRAHGLDRAAAMAPYEYFVWLKPRDQELIVRARQGDATVLPELKRRAEALDAIQAYTRPYSRSSWDAACQRLVALGPDMAEYLAQVLIGLLLQGQYREIYHGVRAQLVEIGEPALGMLMGVLKAKADYAADAPIGPWEEVTQLTAAIVMFGEKGVEPFMAVVASPKRYVRLCAVRAVGELRAIEQSKIVAKMLLEDPYWEVRAGAAEVLGRLRAQARSWKPLLEALGRERDEVVVRNIIAALGRSSCVEAIPKLMNALDDLRSAIQEQAEEALYDITGERITTKVGWVRWYREAYPAWLKKRQ